MRIPQGSAELMRVTVSVSHRDGHRVFDARVGIRPPTKPCKCQSGGCPNVGNRKIEPVSTNCRCKRVGDLKRIGIASRKAKSYRIRALKGRDDDRVANTIDQCDGDVGAHEGRDRQAWFGS